MLIVTFARHARQGRRSIVSFARCILATGLLGGLSVGMAWAQASPAPVAAVPTTAAMHAPVSQVPTSQAAALQQQGGGYSAGAGAPVAVPPPEATAASGPVPATIDTDYRIGTNDLLEVEVFGVEELKRTVRVNASGQVSLPLIGLVPVAGLSPAEAESVIALRYGDKYLQDPQVSIFIKEFTSQRITVDGAVARPGIYPLAGQITLLRALAMAGGGGSLANLEEVMLFRLGPDGQTLTEKHDVMKIRTGEAPDPLLQGDDVVVVNRNSARAALRDSLFSDIIGTLNPFSSIYRNATVP